MRAVLFASATATTSGGRHTGDLFFIYKSGHLMSVSDRLCSWSLAMSDPLRILYLPKNGIFVMKARIRLRILRPSRSVH
jgi:hypothetical protein